MINLRLNPSRGWKCSIFFQEEDKISSRVRFGITMSIAEFRARADVPTWNSRIANAGRAIIFHSSLKEEMSHESAKRKRQREREREASGCLTTATTAFIARGASYRYASMHTYKVRRRVGQSDKSFDAKLRYDHSSGRWTIPARIRRVCEDASRFYHTRCNLDLAGWAGCQGYETGR